jgi:diaminopimelate epimerase
MEKINFTKMVASGNDFVIFEKNKLSALAKQICDRKFGVGADGLLVLGKSKIADVRMRIFNPDGSEAQMCGNGARCAALYMNRRNVDIETKAGIIESRVDGNNVKIKLTNPKDIKLDIPIKINNRKIKVNFIDTGVPHTVIFVEGLDKIDVVSLGRQIRYHRKFAPAGTNIDFVEILNNSSIKVRTYERGVEGETLACGTGAVASALLCAMRYAMPAGRQALYASGKVNIHTKSGEVLKVYFDRIGDKFRDVCLEGKAKIVYKGCWCDE